MIRKLVIGVTGASGAIYAKRLFDKLATLPAEVAVVFTDYGAQVFRHELGEDAFRAIPFKQYHNSDFFAPFASGSSLFDTLIVAPCSMGTLARIAGGLASDLVSRTADVMLKERRKLILVPRETPLNLIHLQNMLRITEAGGIICPAAPSFYNHPQTLEAAADTVADRVLQLAGFEIDTVRWNDTTH
jgi:4-hydroxy-3-polyprenylbenzoate decarboxylase